LNANRKLKPSDAVPRPLSPALALGLGAVVLMVHLWLLSSTPLPLAVQSSEPAPLRWSTRRIEPAPPATSPATSPVTRPTRQAPPQPVATAAHPAAVAPDAAPSNPSHAVADTTLPAEAAPLPHAAQSEPVAAPAAPETLAHAAAPAPSQTPTPALQAAPHPQLPGSARLRYELSGQSRGFHYSAHGELSWQQDSQHYQASMVISGLLMLRPRVMTSVGDLAAEGLVPRRYSDKVRSEQATHFQPERGRIIFSSNAPEAAWQSGTQDRVSMFFQLAGLLAAEPERYKTGAQLQLPTAGSREVETWTFTVTGAPTLELPIGRQATLALRREPRQPYDQTIEIWFAPALGYLPARIRISQGNGDVIDQKLSALEH